MSGTTDLLADTIAELVATTAGSGQADMELAGRLYATGIIERFAEWAEDEEQRGSSPSAMAAVAMHLIIGLGGLLLTWPAFDRRERKAAALLAKGFADGIAEIGDDMGKAIEGAP